jgi:hypothetical protein
MEPCELQNAHGGLAQPAGATFVLFISRSPRSVK